MGKCVRNAGRGEDEVSWLLEREVTLTLVKEGKLESGKKKGEPPTSQSSWRKRAGCDSGGVCVVAAKVL